MSVGALPWSHRSSQNSVVLLSLIVVYVDALKKACT
jgi:hypothetical protein